VTSPSGPRPSLRDPRRLSAALRIRIRRELDRRAILRSGFFDAAWYLDRYPDVARSGTDPALHYLLHGGRERRDPGPRFSSARYLSLYEDVARAGLNPLLHYLRHGKAEGRTEAIVPEGRTEIPVDLDAWFPRLAPIRLRALPGAGPRVSVVVDSVGPESLFGGVATAIVIGAMIAARRGAALRVVTRDDAADRSVVARVLARNGIPIPARLETDRAAVGRGGSVIGDGPDELWLTTLWTTTAAVLGSVPPERVIWLLQDDERIFYPAGDERQRCAETMATEGIRILVNTALLRDHLVAEGFRNVERSGVAFEPAFPALLPHRPRAAGAPRRLLFHARPTHPRNLYHRGVELLDAALADGILDPAGWEIAFVGTADRPLRFARGVRSEVLGVLSFDRYLERVAATDLGLALMASPHPSYPPLDLAGSGAVVVTTRDGRKQDLSAYSPRILCAEPTLPGLLAALAEAVAIAGTEVADPAPGIARSWEASAGPAIDRILGG